MEEARRKNTEKDNEAKEEIKRQKLEKRLKWELEDYEKAKRQRANSNNNGFIRAKPGQEELQPTS